MFWCWRVMSIIQFWARRKTAGGVGGKLNELRNSFTPENVQVVREPESARCIFLRPRDCWTEKGNDGLLTPTHAGGHGREEPVLNTQPRTFLQSSAPCSEAPLHESSAASQTVPTVTDSTASQTVPPLTNWVFKEMFMMDISHSTHTRRA